MSRLTPNREIRDTVTAPFRATQHHASCRPADQDLTWRCCQCGHMVDAEAVLDEIDAVRQELANLRAEYTAPGGTTMGECPIHAIRWLGHAPCPTCQTEWDALAAHVRELEQERQGLIERFHAECCEVECKCHCDELRAALASPRRSA